MIIAELFFKFHSFVLESIAFLAVWYVFGAMTYAVCRRTAAHEPAGPAPSTIGRSMPNSPAASTAAG